MRCRAASKDGCALEGGEIRVHAPTDDAFKQFKLGQEYRVEFVAVDQTKGKV
jgi:hypothetical protein